MKSLLRNVVIVAGSVAIVGCAVSCKSTKAPEKSGVMGGRGMLPPAYLDNSEYERMVRTTPRTTSVAPDAGYAAPSIQVEDDTFASPTPVYDDETPAAPAVEADTTELANDPIETPALDPAPQPKPAATATAGKTYTVRAGDTLSHIAVAHGVKWTEIAALNPDVNPNKVRTGTVLIMPDNSKPTPTGGVSHASSPKKSTDKEGTTTTKKAAAAPADGIYTVASGDSLWTIAHKFGVSIDNLKTWNNLASDHLSVGQKLAVTAAAAKAPAKDTKPAEKPAAKVEVPAVDNTPAAATEPAEVVLDSDTVVEDTAAEQTSVHKMTHRISEDDTIANILNLYGLSEDDFFKANPEIKSDADLVPGTDVLIIY